MVVVVVCTGVEAVAVLSDEVAGTVVLDVATVDAVVVVVRCSVVAVLAGSVSAPPAVETVADGGVVDG